MNWEAGQELGQRGFANWLVAFARNPITPSRFWVRENGNVQKSEMVGRLSVKLFVGMVEMPLMEIQKHDVILEKENG